MATTAARSLNKLFVGNLPWTVSSRELKKYFAEFGHVATVNVIFDKSTGISKGFGFVNFTAKGGLQNANNRQVHNLEGRVLNVRIANRD